jgi:peptidoglycan/xylan/chitin deacetylase (PgdA/CDA1 family)
LPDRVRNGIVKIERSLKKLPSPLRKAGLALLGLVSRGIGSVISVETQEPLVALSFDDGPDPVVTPQVLALLAERGIKATFFVLSERAEENPDLARRLVTEGHEVALHGANHDNLTTLGFGEMVSRVRGGKRRLREVVGSPVRLFRPPYGSQNLRSFALTRLSGMRVVIWSVDPNDWDEIDPQEIVNRTLDKAEPGGIILLHDGWTPNPDNPSAAPNGDKAHVVKLILDALDGAGLGVTTVSDLLASRRVEKKVWFETG